MHAKHLFSFALTIPFALAGCLVALTPVPPSSPLPKSADSLNWVRYTDSAEGAFSIDVPVGWQVNGGMYRFGYFDVRWMIDIRSLDGKIIVRIDDPDVPPYVLPGPNTGRPGQPYFKPQQFQMVVDRYRDASEIAATYANHRFASVCKTLAPAQSAWSPNLPQTWLSNAGDRTTQATAAFDCSTSDGPRTVLVFARSNLHSAANFWNVDPIISLIATPEAVPLGQSMIQHMIDSWQVDPRWEQYQQRMTQMGLDQIRAQFGQFLQQMQAYHQQREAAMNQQVAHFESQQHAQAQQASEWGETLTGLTSVYDSATGTQFQVFSGPKANYYINGEGVKINSSVNPGGGFRQLTEVHP